MVWGPEGRGMGRIAQVYAGECDHEDAVFPNAQAIAAVPELIETLQELIDYIEADATIETEHIIKSGEFFNAKAALKKAGVE
jgi:hypothetical protein